MLASLKAKLDSNLALKAFIHSLLVSKSDARPRWISRFIINPFVHKKASSSKIRHSSRLDVFPFNRFELGAKSTIEDFCVVTNGVGDIIIESGVRIGIGSVLMGPLTVEKNTILGQHVLLTGLDHNYLDPTIAIKNQGVSTKKTHIGADCFIGANACVLPGVSIGKHCVIAAGAVVTKSVPDFHIAAGNPAKLIKKYNFETNEWVRC